MLPLKISEISKSFARPVLDNVNFDVKPNEIFGFIGLNGVGKTTLIKIILDLLDQEGCRGRQPDHARDEDPPRAGASDRNPVVGRRVGRSARDGLGGGHAHCWGTAGAGDAGAGPGGVGASAGTGPTIWTTFAVSSSGVAGLMS